MDKSNDIVIIGAGPAGVTCALHLANKGIPVTLIDKASFPRDKICGDALSGNVIYELALLGESVPEKFGNFKSIIATDGIKFVAPSGQSLNLKMHKVRPGFSHAGFVSERLYFDNFLMELARENPLISIMENIQVHHLAKNKNEIQLFSKSNELIASSKMVVGADGAHSVVSKYAGNHLNKKHHSAGLRQYWSNVTGFEEGNYIELHFDKKAIPGYFWMFPLEGNKANIGIGLKSDIIARKKINLKTLFAEIMETHPTISARFKNAQPLEEPKGFGLPLGSKKIKLSGDHFILLGDAASLIDPFTGEGIGNAMISGRIAANHIEKAIAAKRFTAEFNFNYDKQVYKKLASDLNISYRLQRLLRFPGLFNAVVKKANKNPHFHEFIEQMLEDPTKRKSLTGLNFYYHILFNPKKKN